ncbi:MAG: tRNA (adenosine(37)-N6)-threonylcarbamoyltransferase complex dimerization subunit type 1 TsaB [Clostridia bacterium]|nr:tRNA (adenosine(37)-N6)-threonylcarbamoyltransferase complex dimerization subunit type 1 TsaB [Clostridia bacterium]
MRILAVDTCAKTAAAAITEGRTLLAESSVKTDTHSVTLLPMIEALLRAADTKLGEIDLMAVTVGPGSFTGVRIGVSAVKGLAFADRIPCVGISSLEGMAYNFAGIDTLVVPVIDARRGMVYAALFRASSDGTVTRLTEDEQLPMDELAEMLRGYAGERIYFTGDATGMMIGRDDLPEGVAVTPEKLRIPSAYGVAARADAIYAEASEAAKEGFTDAALAPVYLRKSQAEREREERLAKQNNGSEGSL